MVENKNLTEFEFYIILHFIIIYFLSLCVQWNNIVFVKKTIYFKLTS